MYNFWNLRLKGKLIITYILFAVIPLCLINIFSYYFYQQRMRENANDLLSVNINQHEQLIYERLQNLQQNMYNLLITTDIMNYIKVLHEENASASEITVAKTKLMESFRLYGGAEFVLSLSTISSTNQYVSYGFFLDILHDLFLIDDTLRQNFYNEAITFDKWGYFSTGQFTLQDYGYADLLHMTFPIRAMLGEKIPYGLLVVTIDKAMLSSYDDGVVQANNLKGNGVLNLVIDSTDTVIFSDSFEYLFKTYTDICNFLKYEGAEVQEWRQNITSTTWDLVTFLDESVYMKDSKIFLRQMLFITLFIALIFYFFIVFLLKKYMNSIYKIYSGMHAYTVGLEYTTLSLSEKDELYVIAQQFNTMAGEINELIRTLKCKNDEIQTAIMYQKNAEIKALEAQINPHFLYNTLDAINWLAIDHNEMKISKMLGMLGSILRYSITDINSIVMLKHEIKWLNKYICLHKERLNCSFDCFFDIQQDTLDFPVYKMLLQPIIENIFIHAFEQIKTDGFIYVTTEMIQNEKLQIIIKDNGCGIKPATLKKLHAVIEHKTPMHMDNIGINNVINRLQIYYQGYADIILYSKPGEGTEVKLLLPKLGGGG